MDTSGATVKAVKSNVKLVTGEIETNSDGEVCGASDNNSFGGVSGDTDNASTKFECDDDKVGDTTEDATCALGGTVELDSEADGVGTSELG